MKTYRVTGKAPKAGYHSSRELVAQGVTSRQAADAIMRAAVEQGWAALDVEIVELDDDQEEDRS
jgi:hypothetical protein